MKIYNLNGKIQNLNLNMIFNMMKKLIIQKNGINVKYLTIIWKLIQKVFSLSINMNKIKQIQYNYAFHVVMNFITSFKLYVKYKERKI